MTNNTSTNNESTMDFHDGEENSHVKQTWRDLREDMGGN